MPIKIKFFGNGVFSQKRSSIQSFLKNDTNNKKGLKGFH